MVSARRVCDTWSAIPQSQSTDRTDQLKIRALRMSSVAVIHPDSIRNRRDQIVGRHDVAVPLLNDVFNSQAPGFRHNLFSGSLRAHDTLPIRGSQFQPLSRSAVARPAILRQLAAGPDEASEKQPLLAMRNCTDHGGPAEARDALPKVPSNRKI